MKAKTLLAIIALISQTNAWAQNLNLQWVNQIGGGNSTAGQRLTINSSNYLYVLGMFEGTIDIDPSSFNLVNLTHFDNNSSDYFIAKYDLNGNYQNYHFQFHTTQTTNLRIHTMAADQFGNIYIGGDFVGGITIGNQYWASFNQNLSSGFVARFDTNGNLTWFKHFTSAANNSVRGIALDSNDDLVVSGYFAGSVLFSSNTVVANGTDGFIVKYDGATNDEFEWFAQLTDAGGNEDILRMTKDALDNIYIVGNFNSTTDFEFGVTSTNPITSNNSGTVYFAKYNSALALQWVKNIGLDGGAFNIEDIEVDSNGNVYLAGGHIENNDIDPSASNSSLPAINPNINASRDGFFAKYNVNGDYLFGKVIGTSEEEKLHEIIPLPCGEILVSGYTTANEAFLDPNNLSNITYTGASRFFAAYDANGAYFSHQKTEFSLENIIWHNGSIYATSGFNSTIDFDPNSGSNPLTSASSTSDLFYARYDVNNCVFVSTNEMEEKLIGVYPNPSTGLFNLETTENVSYQIFDPVGRLVLINSAEGNTSIDMSNQPSGIYTLQLQTAKGTVSHKLVKN